MSAIDRGSSAMRTRRVNAGELRMREGHTYIIILLNREILVLYRNAKVFRYTVCLHA